MIFFFRTISRYRSKKNKWTQMRAKLKKGRRRHAMVASGNKIFAIGGFNSDLEEGARVQNSIEEFELDTGTDFIKSFKT